MRDANAEGSKPSALSSRFVKPSRSGSDQPIQLQESDNLIQRALIAIRESAHRTFTVADLANITRTTQRTLERHFAQHHVRSPQQEIIHVRLERATRMLANPEIPIKEIAFTCGFGSPKLMNYNFQRFRMQTPGNLRKQIILDRLN